MGVLLGVPSREGMPSGRPGVAFGEGQGEIGQSIPGWRCRPRSLLILVAWSSSNADRIASSVQYFQEQGRCIIEDLVHLW